MTDPPNQAEMELLDRTKPRPGCLLFALPILLTVAMGIGYVLLFSLGYLGTTARGERVTLIFDSCPEAHALIQRRVDDMGLGEPEWQVSGQTLECTATLPGRMPDVDARIPSVLAQPGRLRIYAGEAQRDDALLIDHDGVASTLFTLKELGNPLIQVRLHEKSRMTLRTFMDEHPEQSFSVWLDDHSIISRPNQPPLSGTTLELRDHDEDGTKILARTAEWSIVLKNGPLPCPVQWTQKASEDDSH